MPTLLTTFATPKQRNSRVDGCYGFLVPVVRRLWQLQLLVRHHTEDLGREGEEGSAHQRNSPLTLD